jgi:hypothetical protein
MPKRKKDAASLRKPREKKRKNYLLTDIDTLPVSDLTERPNSGHSRETANGLK